MLWKEYEESQAEQSNSSSSTANSEASATVQNGGSSQPGGGSTDSVPNNNGTVNGQSHDNSNEMLSANSFYHESDEDISDFSLNDSEDDLNAGNYTVG